MKETATTRAGRGGRREAPAGAGRRGGLPLKFAATGLLFLLPLALLLGDFQSEINRGIRVAELERAGRRLQPGP